MTGIIDIVAQRTFRPIRRLSADDLGIGAVVAAGGHASNRPDDPRLEQDDPRLVEVVELLNQYGGVIFTGPPGTSKTWYASKIAMHLAENDQERVRFVQFHPSYQYEDFMQGFVPRVDGEGFELKDRHFIQMCVAAQTAPDLSFFLVIDELSRADAGRVFGEALTYVEKSKRGITFSLASGQLCQVPENLHILATMNPSDRGVDEVDAAFERRFAKIAMEPSVTTLRLLLEANEAEDGLIREVLSFFQMVNGRARSNMQGAVGHTFFVDVRDATDLRRVWKYQLRFLLEKAYRLDADGLRDVSARWERIFTTLDTQAQDTLAAVAESGATMASQDDDSDVDGQP